MRRLSVLVVAGLLLAGCGGKKTLNQSDMPDFVVNPPKEAGYLFGTGIGNQKDPQLGKEMADLNARKDLTAVIGSKISIMLKNFMSQAGQDNPELAEVYTSVTRSISDIDLVGATIEKRAFKDGKWYSLSKYPLDEALRKNITDAVQKSLSSKEALLSQFRAKQGFEELDKELDKMKAGEE